ncbi:DUF4837 family protein [Natronoflexus pectinivorans]|uniref:Uncharacterized protein DUF4837 n=1 Tax=Natronoflexus pectinivorans TaxID=682526 RepID=A0A4R2GKR0_9BACT|nr:DUF4837 family protein [Natronoflexus pectinivorans]TCO07979.1 uncharacterized protein DUF4837 [Natronoflexus pectinivorans]
MKILHLFIIAALAIISSSCKDGSFHKPNITGSMGEVLVVMDDRWRNSEPGEQLQYILRQPMEGLPQVESIFTLSMTPHRAFSDNMRTFRNLLITNIGPDVDTEGVRFFSETTWARGQYMVHINARTPEKFLEILDENELRILGFFLRAERQRSISYFRNYPNADLTEEVRRKWDIDIIIPNTFRKNNSQDDFTWMSHETNISSQGLFIWSFDYQDESSLSRELILNKRDSLLRANVPGHHEGSFMSTEHDIPITYKRFKLNDHQAVELRGLWKVVGDLMGGPFVLYAHHDVANNRVVVTDGYVFLPNEPKKRNLVWQLEAISYTVKFPANITQNTETES